MSFDERWKKRALPITGVLMLALGVAISIQTPFWRNLVTDNQPGPSANAASTSLVLPPVVHGLMGLGALLAGILCLAAVASTKRAIVLLQCPMSSWDPARWLNRKSRYRFIYRPFGELTNNNASHPQVLMPLSDDFAVITCDQRQHLQDQNYQFMTCDESDTIDRLANKVKLANHELQEYLPRTYTRDAVVYPCVLKYNQDGASFGVFQINNEAELDDKTRNKTLNVDYIIQEAILDTKEYSTQFLVHEGRIAVHCSYYDNHDQSLFIWPRDKSTSTERFKLDENSDLYRTFARFLRDYNGLINCNYKLPQGNLKVLEFNARLSGDIYVFNKDELNKLIATYLRCCDADQEKH
jgi:hypothetical protein